MLENEFNQEFREMLAELEAMGMGPDEAERWAKDIVRARISLDEAEIEMIAA